MTTNASAKVGMLQWKLRDRVGYVNTLGEAKAAIQEEGKFDFHHFHDNIKWTIGRVDAVEQTKTIKRYQKSDGSGENYDAYDVRDLVFVTEIISGHVTVDTHRESIPRGRGQGQVR